MKFFRLIEGISVPLFSLFFRTIYLAMLTSSFFVSPLSQKNPKELQIIMLTIEILRALLLGFTIGLTALVPGPMLFATIELSLKKGWHAGPKVVLGHMLIELVLFILILFGFASIVRSSTISTISVVGGLALAVFGFLTVKDAKTAASAEISTEISDLKLTSNPVALGLITSVSNPYFWICG